MNKQLTALFLRYITLIILGLNNLILFYAIFTPLTIYPSYFLLSIIDKNTTLITQANSIIFKNLLINLTPACIAGTAYYLLLILNLTTPMKKNIRAKSIIFILSCFLILNLIRIFIFSILAFKGYQYFDITHKTVWYFGSTVMLIAIWFANVKIFRIKEIPIYHDMKKFLLQLYKKT